MLRTLLYKIQDSKIALESLWLIAILASLFARYAGVLSAVLLLVILNLSYSNLLALFIFFLGWNLLLAESKWMEDMRLHVSVRKFKHNFNKLNYYYSSFEELKNMLWPNLHVKKYQSSKEYIFDKSYDKKLIYEKGIRLTRNDLHQNIVISNYQVPEDISCRIPASHIALKSTFKGNLVITNIDPQNATDFQKFILTHELGHLSPLSKSISAFITWFKYSPVRFMIFMSSFYLYGWVVLIASLAILFYYCKFARVNFYQWVFRIFISLIGLAFIFGLLIDPSCSFITILLFIFFSMMVRFTLLKDLSYALDEMSADFFGVCNSDISWIESTYFVLDKFPDLLKDQKLSKHLNRIRLKYLKASMKEKLSTHENNREFNLKFENYLKPFDIYLIIALIFEIVFNILLLVCIAIIVLQIPQTDLIKPSLFFLAIVILIFGVRHFSTFRMGHLDWLAKNF